MKQDLLKSPTDGAGNTRPISYNRTLPSYTGSSYSPAASTLARQSLRGADSGNSIVERTNTHTNCGCNNDAIVQPRPFMNISAVPADQPLQPLTYPGKNYPGIAPPNPPRP